MIFYGTEGMLEAGRWVGGKYAFRVFDVKGEMVHYEREETSETGTMPHVRNFVDCVRTQKKPNADAETGRISATLCHLGSIVVRTGRNLSFDGGTETILNDPEASKYMTREYRDHWSSKPFRTA